MFAPICLAAYLHTHLLSLYLPTCTSTRPTACRGSKSNTNQNPTECLQILYLSTCLPAYALACLNTYLPAYLPTPLQAFLSKCQLICVPAYLPDFCLTYLHIWYPVYQHACLPSHLPIYLPAYLPACVSIRLLAFCLLAYLHLRFVEADLGGTVESFENV